jgi:AcrR family transcriptional regulator
MPRVIKHPDVRGAELLDRASRLFVQHGYDNVSLNDLIADAGVSQDRVLPPGSIKDALITAITECNVDQEIAAVEDALAQCSGNALDRLNAVLQAGFDVKMRMGTPEQLAAGVSLLRPENAYLYGRIVAIGEERLRPLFTRVLSEGVAQGIFDTFDPEGVGDDPRPCAGHETSTDESVGVSPPTQPSSTRAPANLRGGRQAPSCNLSG